MAGRASPRQPAWLPRTPERVRVIGALKAMAEGEANGDQQKRALHWILHEVCEYGEGHEPFYSDADGGARETAFALGKQYVARQILRQINMPGEMVEKLKEKESNDVYRSDRSERRDPDKPRS